MNVLDPNSLQVLSERICSALNAPVRCGLSPILPGLEGLLDAERQAIQQAVAKRQREFATGRMLAHKLMREAGIPRVPLLPGADRAPRWPPGVVGSISHSSELCGVLLGLQVDCRSMGLDLEPRTPLESELWPLVCTPREQEALKALPTAVQGECAKSLFSIKEAVYKCQHPLTKQFLDFQDVEVFFEGIGWQCATNGQKLIVRNFHAHLPVTVELAGCPRTLEGKLFLADDWIVSALLLKSHSSQPLEERS